MVRAAHREPEAVVRHPHMSRRGGAPTRGHHRNPPGESPESDLFQDMSTRVCVNMLKMCVPAARFILLLTDVVPDTNLS